jgi:phage regulator Rha-like protein
MELQIIQQKIHEIRGQKVMLDFDLAALYEVETKRLKESVRRNIERFPEDFMFELTQSEYQLLRSQIATLEVGRGKYSKYLPFDFTEHGVAMLSSVLNSEKAIQVNIAIFRAFIALRHLNITFAQLAEKIISHDKELADINEVLKYLGEENQQRTDEISAVKVEIEQKNEVEPQNTWDDRQRIGFNKADYGLI